MLRFIEKLQELYYQLLEYLFYDDYQKRKVTLETKKCKNCLNRVSLHWHICPWCKHSDFSFNEEYLYNEGMKEQAKAIDLVPNGIIDTMVEKGILQKRVVGIPC